LAASPRWAAASSMPFSLLRSPPGAAGLFWQSKPGCNRWKCGWCRWSPAPPPAEPARWPGRTAGGQHAARLQDSAVFQGQADQDAVRVGFVGFRRFAAGSTCGCSKSPEAISPMRTARVLKTCASASRGRLAG
jgi:hypothetical protein